MKQQIRKKTSSHNKKKSPSKFAYIYVCLILLASLNISYIHYIRLKSQDLSYAIEYNLTSNFSFSKKLMHVNNIKLIDKNNDIALIKATGLSCSTPHHKISISASFKKCNNSWILQYIY